MSGLLRHCILCYFILALLITMTLSIQTRCETADVSSIDDLLQNLSHNDAKIRCKAAWDLGKSGDVRAVNPLIIALEDDDRNVREWAAIALAKIGKPSIEPLEAALESGNDSIKWQAAAVLGLINDTNCTEALSLALQSKNSTVRYWAASSLGLIKNGKSQEALVSALGDCNESVRDKAGWALRTQSGEKAIMLLIDLLQDENSSRRMGAARALGDLNDVRAVPSLVQSLQDSEPGMRIEAAVALGRLKDGRAIEPLISALNDQDERMRAKTIDALVAIGPEAVIFLIPALNSSNNYTSVAAATALGKIADGRCAESLIWAFQNDERPVRRASVMALARINTSIAVPVFISILQDQSRKDDLRTDAAWALGEMGDASARDPLITAMASDPDSGVRINAAQALKNIGRTNVPVYSI